MIALDTNLLVYAHRSRTAEHRAARMALLRASRSAAGWGFAFPVLAEFWRVVTHPAAPGGPSTPDQAADFLHALLDAGAECWLPLPGFARRILTGSAQTAARGNAIFDLQIALIALEAGATEIWTHDHDFLALPGLDVRDPLS